MQTSRVLSLIVLVTMVASCANQGDSASAENKTITIDLALRDAANFLGGVELATNSSLANSANQPRYRAWAQGFDKVWRETQKPNLDLIASWAKANLERADLPERVFYPFSGPDIINALAFFPAGKEYTLFGMEPAGLVPRPEQDDFNRQMQELGRLQNSLADILVLNFFQTLHMEVQVREASYSSVSGILLFFLTRAGMEVVAGRNISIDTNGEIVTNYQPKNPRYIPGVEYSFRKREPDSSQVSASRDEIKRIRYFSLDISNPGLEKNPNFESYASRELRDTATMAKSASFLMHKDFFSRIRELILVNSAYILQDDSAIPQRFFLNPGWEVEYYGFYDKPIPLFSNYFQRELLTNLRAKSKGRLAFSYGYDHIKGSSNLILAIRQPETK